MKHATLADYGLIRAHLRRLVEASKNICPLVTLDNEADPALMDAFVEALDGAAEMLKETPEPPPQPVPNTQVTDAQRSVE